MARSSITRDLHTAKYRQRVRPGRRQEEDAKEDFTTRCEACGNDDWEQPHCEGCACCQECCNCTPTDCDCEVCADRRRC